MTNEKAFPYKEYIDSTDPQTINPIHHSGMSLRDYFAAKAIQHFCWDGENDADCAIGCYEIADAMMEARNEKTQDKTS